MQIPVYDWSLQDQNHIFQAKLESYSAMGGLSCIKFQFADIYKHGEQQIS